MFLVNAIKIWKPATAPDVFDRIEKGTWKTKSLNDSPVIITRLVTTFVIAIPAISALFHTILGSAPMIPMEKYLEVQSRIFDPRAKALVSLGLLPKSVFTALISTCMLTSLVYLFEKRRAQKNATEQLGQTLAGKSKTEKSEITEAQKAFLIHHPMLVEKLIKNSSLNLESLIDTILDFKAEDKDDAEDWKEERVAVFDLLINHYALNYPLKPIISNSKKTEQLLKALAHPNPHFALCMLEKNYIILTNIGDNRNNIWNAVNSSGIAVALYENSKGLFPTNILKSKVEKYATNPNKELKEQIYYLLQVATYYPKGNIEYNSLRKQIQPDDSLANAFKQAEDNSPGLKSEDNNPAPQFDDYPDKVTSLFDFSRLPTRIQRTREEFGIDAGILFIRTTLVFVVALPIFGLLALSARSRLSIPTKVIFTACSTILTPIIYAAVEYQRAKALLAKRAVDIFNHTSFPPKEVSRFLTDNWNSLYLKNLKKGLSMTKQDNQGNTLPKSS